jgi:predicted small secreted protein
LKKSALIILSLTSATILLSACTQETQNKFGRAVQNWTGTNGVLEIYAGDKLVKRFLEIDKLSTAVSTQGNAPRPYRFGYGIDDLNLNNQKDPSERKVYFEFSDYSTSYIFFEKSN